MDTEVLIEEATTPADSAAAESVPAESTDAEPVGPTPADDDALAAVLEAVLYANLAGEPLAAPQIAQALQQPLERVQRTLERIAREYDAPHRGLSLREVAGGFQIATKPEHHEAIRAFKQNLKPPLKLSLAALETLAVIAYKQPITGPEIADVRGVQGASVLKTLLDRRLITAAGRKNVVGKPILYKTTREFLMQFGLSGLGELPSLKEFEELRRLALSEPEPEPAESADSAAPADRSREEPAPEA